MESMDELTSYVSEKAKRYMEETGENMDKFPLSIVDFVIEYAVNECHFPEDYAERDIVRVLEKRKKTLSTMCVEVYDKVGGEGEISHTENGISRTYETSWISPGLMEGFPNYANF